MSELGELLRTAREAKGLTLEQVEQAIRIRSMYLQALENEEFDKLPHAAYVKGFIHNYAVFLGLDAQKASELYQPPVPAAPSPSPILVDQPLLRTNGPWLRPAAVIAVLAIIAAIVLGVLYLTGRLRWSTGRPPSPTATITPVPPSPTLAPTWTPAPTLEPTRQPTVAPILTQAPTPRPLALLTVAVDVVAQPSWLQVWVDGQEVLARTLAAGARVGWTAEERIIVRSGNAGAVHVTADGVDMGILGDWGKVVEREWTATGIPTRTPTPR